jgi:hypothetical protein
MARTVDPALGLAMAMQAGHGRFALLLGSGVSMPSGIPTGWGVVNDLAMRLAIAEGAAELPEDPIEWFIQSQGSAPDYSGLLEALAPTAGQRRDLLSGYFEPSAADREAGLKQPTAAHRAIAGLVSRGVVRVIVTTNFDRLLEQAIQAAGVEPIVVATPDAARGTIPLAHTRCTVIKVHGDYLDPNIKNTVGELDSYEPALDALLDRVFDDYGLVICGWSATWDRALRNAILRSPNRRYAAYWAGVGDLSTEAERVIAHRDATLVNVQDADSFFTTLAARIDSLDDLARRGAVGIDVIAAQAKRLLPDPVNRIRLIDTAMDAVERSLATIDFDGNRNGQSVPEYVAKAAEIESATGELSAIHAVLGAFADRADHHALIRRSLERSAAPTRTLMGGLTAWINLRGYPTLLGLYSAGIGAVAHENWASVAAVFSASSIDPGRGSGEAELLVTLLPSYRVLDAQAVGTTFEGASRKTPVSDYLHDRLELILRPTLRLGDDEFDDLFDLWEYMLGVAQQAVVGHGVVGRWAWRHRWDRFENRAPDRALLAARDVLLAAGVFDGSTERMEQERAEFDAMVSRSGIRW